MYKDMFSGMFSWYTFDLARREVFFQLVKDNGIFFRAKFGQRLGVTATVTPLLDPNFTILSFVTGTSWW